MNNNHVFRAFDTQVDCIKSWLRTRVFAIAGYSTDVITDRILQRVVEIGLRAYGMFVSRSYSTPNPLPVLGTQINCGPASITIGQGRIRISSRQFLVSQREFAVHWAYCAVALIFASRRRYDFEAGTLVFGVGDVTLFRDGSDEHFVAYCRSGPILPLRQGRRLFIESKSGMRSSFPEEFVYARHPLIQLLREAPLGVAGRFGILLKHLHLFVTYEFAVMRLRPLALLGRDFAYAAVASELDRRGLISAILFTCSNYDSQPVWARGLRCGSTHMIWYSQNAKPTSYLADKVTSDFPNYRWIRADHHWVWTTGFADYLKGLGLDAQFQVVGPLVWTLPIPQAAPEDTIEIAVFDVSPFGDDVALEFGEITNYNNPDNLTAFIEDILALKPEIERKFQTKVTFRLKTKRGYQAGYDKGYFSMIEQLAATGALSLEPHTSNMFGMISRSRLVVAYPFTSPIYIADTLGVPSIYYDPTASIAPAIFANSPSLIRFASGPGELLDAALLALGTANHPISASGRIGMPPVRRLENGDVKTCDL